MERCKKIYISWLNKEIRSAIYALFSLFPFCIDMQVITAADLEGYSGRLNVILNELRLSFNGNSALLLLLFIMLYKFYCNYNCKNDTKTSIPAFILANIYSAILLSGGSFYRTASWYEIFSCSTAQGIKAILVYAGMVILSCFALMIIFDYIWSEKSEKRSKWVCTYSVKSLLITWLLILLCWLPYIVIKYPGITSWDTGTVLKQYFDENTVSNGVPVFTVLYFVLYIRIGDVLGSQNIGLALFVLVQSLTMSLVLSYYLCYLERCKVIFIYRIILLMMICILPLYPYTAMQMGSDVPYTITIILYTIFLVRFVWKKENIRWYEWAFEAVVLSLMTLFRHTGICIVVSSIIILCFFGIRDKKVILVHVVAITAYLLWSSIAVPFFTENNAYVQRTSDNIGVQQAEVFGAGGSVIDDIFVKEEYRELVSEAIPTNNNLVSHKSQKVLGRAVGRLFEKIRNTIMDHTGQQIAYYVINYIDELSEEELQVLNKMLIVNEIADAYNPELADNIDRIMKHGSVSNEDAIEYLKLWGRLFSKHPGAYMQATINMWYGYFYPDYLCKTKKYIFNELENVWDSENLKIFYSYKYGYERELVESWKEFLYKVPLVGTLYGIGIYTWMLIFSIVYIIWKRAWEAFVLVVPVILTLLICMISPVCGYTRYAFPVMFCMPFIFALWFTYDGKKVIE